ncbi:MAG: ECF transporter S component [Erysipelotrichaceae bacterium]|nr:ECF transporter S component [Erysipelotrichaceae bacterium]
MNRNRKIAFIGLGIALYAVLSAFVYIPIINRIKLDLGYIVFGLYLNTFGMISTLVGVFGCIIGNLLKGGSLPIAWATGQAFIGLSLGYLLPKTDKMWLKIIYCIISTFIGIVVIKTAIEIAMYHYPFWAKTLSNCVAYIADVIPMIIGVILSKKIRIIK